MRGVAIVALPLVAGSQPLPPWPATYNLSRSTFLMPCNYTGYFDPIAAAS
jgi:hypothetical protein